jgi:hypothetical protein
MVENAVRFRILVRVDPDSELRLAHGVAYEDPRVGVLLYEHGCRSPHPLEVERLEELGSDHIPAGALSDPETLCWGEIDELPEAEFSFSRVMQTPLCGKDARAASHGTRDASVPAPAAGVALDIDALVAGASPGRGRPKGRGSTAAKSKRGPAGEKRSGGKPRS